MKFIGTKLLVAILAVFTVESQGFSECLSTIEGMVVIDVNRCIKLDPVASFDPEMDKYSFIKNFSPPDRKQFFDSYRGYVITGKIVKSSATNKGLSEGKGVLLGNKVSVFVPPGAGTCKGIPKRRVSGKIKEYCCNGSLEAPCALKSNLIFTKLKALGASSRSGDKARTKIGRNKLYRKAEKLFKKGKFKKVIPMYRKLASNGNIDNKGLYHLAYSYRKLDLCRKAIRPLKTIYDKYMSNKSWADEEKLIRKANLLLARCFSKENRPEEAVVILNSYLVEPKKYRYELRRGLKDPDFGWIHTSKQYRDFKSAAGKVVDRR